MRVAAVGVCLLVAACSATPPRATPTTPAPTPTSSTSTSPPRPDPTSPPPEEPRAPLTVAVAGDVHFEGVLRTRLDDPATALAPVTDTLAAADLAIVNLETAIGTGGSPDPNKRYTFRAPPSALEALTAAGVDVATMANNHAVDFGPVALDQTLRAKARAPLSIVGVGRDLDDAFAPALTEVDGTTVATIGATVADADPTADPTGQWAATPGTPGTADAIDPRRLLRAVADADRTSDVVITYLHWGVQGERCPSDLQRSLAADLVDAGADLVVGSHTHGLQGDGRLGPGYVAYGLGNYAWYTPSDTAVLTLTVQPPRTPAGRARVTDAAWTPATIGADGLPRQVRDPGFAAEIEDLRDCAGF